MASTDHPLNQPHLSKQDLASLDIAKLTPLSPEVISRQATINIGTIGHVAHGKSTVVKAISGVQTVRFKNELERNITIKLERLSQSRIDELTASKAKLREYLRGEDGRRHRLLKSGKCRRILDLRYRESGIQCQVEWKRADGRAILEGPRVTWQHFNDIKENKDALGCLQQLIDTHPLDYREIVTGDRVPPVLKKALPQQANKEFNDHLYYCYLFLYRRALDIGVIGPNFLEKFTAIHHWYVDKEQRPEQSAKLQELQKKFCKLSGVNVLVVNNVDYDVPTEFLYVSECFSSSVDLPQDPLIGCSCRKCNVNSKCCPELAGSTAAFAYNKDKLMTLEPGKAIYECNSRCQCDQTCPNRVLQLGYNIDLCVFKTRDRGWGLKAMQPLRRGQFISEYTGEIIDFQQAEERGKEYDNIGLTYLFDLDYNNAERPYTVDAFAYGNLSRFINHSCNPNCAIWAVFVNCLDPNLPRLGIFTLRDVAAGEELTFDYMAGQDAMAEDAKHTGQCLCNAKRCRNFLFV